MVLVASIDITAQKISEENTNYSKTLLEVHNQASVDGILLVDAKGKIISYNKRFIEIWRMPQEIVDAKDDEAALAFAMTQLVNPDQFIDKVKWLYDNPTKTSLDELTYKDGRIVERYGYPVVGNDGTYYAWSWTFRDITINKKNEEAIKEAGERFRTMADNISQLAWMTDETGWIFWYNQRWYDYTGTNLDEMQGWGWQSVHHPDHVDRVTVKFSQYLQSGEAWEDTFPLRSKDGEFRWFLSRAIPVKDVNGKIVRWFGTNTDITEQNKILDQLESKNEQLIRINNDLDNFIYTASHDLKAPMSNIEGLVIALKDNLKSKENIIDEETGFLFQLMEKSIERFKRTILDLTDITKVQKQHDEDVYEIDLLQVIEDVELSINDQIIQSGAKIFTNFSKINTIKFSKKNMNSIIYNLLSNAIKYRDKSRVPEILITTERDGEYTVLLVKDNGLGINENNKSKMFTMFKRFHDHVEGTGIGLYIIKRIIDNAGGKIEVESEIGKGTTFKVYFKG